MNQVDSLIQKTSAASKKWGYITILLGILAIALPMLVGVAITILLSIVLMLAGLVQVITTIPGKGRTFRLILAYLTLIAGVALLLAPKFGLATLTLFLGVYFWLDALANIVAAWRLTPNHGWGHVAINGLSSLIMAVIIMWQWPTSSEFVIGILVGIKLISLGSVLLFLSRSASNLQTPYQPQEKIIN